MRAQLSNLLEISIIQRAYSIACQGRQHRRNSKHCKAVPAHNKFNIFKDCRKVANVYLTQSIFSCYLFFAQNVLYYVKNDGFGGNDG